MVTSILTGPLAGATTRVGTGAPNAVLAKKGAGRTGQRLRCWCRGATGADVNGTKAFMAMSVSVMTQNSVGDKSA